MYIKEEREGRSEPHTSSDQRDLQTLNDGVTSSNETLLKKSAVKECVRQDRGKNVGDKTPSPREKFEEEGGKGVSWLHNGTAR